MMSLVPVEEQEACARLWLAVIEAAVDDLEELRRLRQRRSLTKSEKERATQIYGSAPADFFSGPTFREVCELLGLNPEWVSKEYELSRFGVRMGRRRAKPKTGAVAK
jgi:hypothetical protein